MTAAGPDLLSHALDYAKRGWAVVPLHTPTIKPNAKSICSCSKWRTCTSVGKHPRTKEGLTEATRDIDQITRWWTKWPNANIGIVTGRASGGLVVLDVDSARAGEDALRDLQDRFGQIPSTQTVLTGNGMHLYLVATGDVGNSVDVVARGLDIRGDDGYVVAPPSLHHTSRRYEWEGVSFDDEGNTIPLARAPQWLLDLSAKRQRAPLPKAGEPITDSREVTLFRLACKLRRSGLSQDSILAAIRLENEQRVVPPLDDHEVVHAVEQAAKYNPEDDYGAPAPDPVDPEEAIKQPPPRSPADVNNQDWTRGLMRKPDGKNGTPGEIIKCMANGVTILQHDKEWRYGPDHNPILVWDEFRTEVRTIQAPPWHDDDRPGGPGEAAVWRDSDNGRLANWFMRNYRLNYSEGDCASIALLAAQRSSVNPARVYLDSVRAAWDGVPRLATWLHDYFGVEQNAYAASVGTWWLTSAVARIYEPGCKADHVLILEGPQGEGKSTALRNLCPSKEWFSDSQLIIGNKDTYMCMRGRWIFEIPELVSLNNLNPNVVKAFFSSATDTYRQPWGRVAVQVPRQCIFAGSVNPELTGYLDDPTGARRFWPVECQGDINFDGVAAIRDQLWGEAVTRYFLKFAEGSEQHEWQWWPGKEDRPMFHEKAKERFKQDVWLPAIAQWLESDEAQRTLADNDLITTLDVLQKALKVPLERIGRSEQTRVGSTMAHLGWERTRSRINRALVWGYAPSAPA